MKRLLVLLFALAVALTACARPDPEPSEAYLRMKAAVEAAYPAPAGESIVDHLASEGISCIEVENGVTNSCFLIEGDSSANMFADDYWLAFEEGGKRYETRGRVLVSSERQPFREAFIWVLGHAEYENALYAPFDSDRWVLYGDNGNKDDRFFYYYDKDQYISVLSELFGVMP